MAIIKRIESDKKENGVKRIVFETRLVLPNVDGSGCLINETEFAKTIVQGQLEEVYQDISSPIQATIAGIESLNSFASVVVKCCTDGNDISECVKCIDHGNIENNPTINMHKKLVEKGFVLELVDNIIDNEYIPVPKSSGPITLRKDEKESDVRSGEEMKATVDFFDKKGQDLDGLGSDISNGLLNDLHTNFGRSGLTYGVHYFKFPRDCGSFDTKMDEYENDDSDFVLFIALNHLDNAVGEVGFHFKTNLAPSSYNHGNGSESRSVSPDLVKEAAEGLREIADIANVCGNLISGIGGRGHFNISNTIGKVVMSDEQKKIFNDYYENWNEESQKELEYATETFSYYYGMEYNILIANGSWRIIAWIHANNHLCSQDIHTALAFCGLYDPAGIWCDGGDALLYFLEGNGKEGIISLAATIPVIGVAITEARMGGTVLENSEGVKTILKWSWDKALSAVHWVGGHSKLKSAYLRQGVVKKFNGEILDPTANPLHHIFPWAYVNKKAVSFRKELTEKLLKAGWNPSNPYINGIPLPEYCIDGLTKFHNGSHDEYNKWFIEIVERIVERDEKILERMTKLSKKVESLLEGAYLNNTKINDIDYPIYSINEIDNFL